ncbi:MAG: NAD(P)/FAD-dependent oxidoreductase [Verrucomicrobiota bacterium]
MVCIPGTNNTRLVFNLNESLPLIPPGQGLFSTAPYHPFHLDTHPATDTLVGVPADVFANTPSASQYDAIIIGSGPNGFAAAITLAQNKCSTLLIEARDTPGGGMRSRDDLTLPGFTHDVCSAVHPLAAASPFFRSLPLESLGLKWIHPDLPLAHPLDHGRAAVMARSIPDTVAAFPSHDADQYHSIFAPLARNAPALLDELLGPLPLPPKHPFLLARFGRHAIRSGVGFATHNFQSDEARALFAGNAAHSVLPLKNPLTAAVGMMLAVTGHHVGWPIAEGGSNQIANALTSHYLSLGGEIVCNHEVKSLAALPDAKAILFNTSPKALAKIASDQLPSSYRQKLTRYRYGPGVFKLDLALSHPIPWTAKACRRAGTVHVGGTLEEIAASEQDAWNNRISNKPFVLVAQQSVFDPTRAPASQHTGWAYCHVPNGADADMTEPILNQIERFAPGFRDTILASHPTSPAGYESYNPNFIGGDIIGGAQDLPQLFTRPVARLNPYTTPNPKLYLCSAATPPGAGVHGMAGYHAARTALAKHLT